METQVAPGDQLKNRFRGFYPVIVDVETAGLCSQTDALLEIGAYFVRMTPTGTLETEEHFHAHVKPFEGANLDKEALEFNGIDPFNPLRGAIDEKEAISSFFKAVDKKRKRPDASGLSWWLTTPCSISGSSMPLREDQG